MLFQTLAFLVIAPAYTLALPTAAPAHYNIARRLSAKNLLASLLPAGQGSKFWSTSDGLVDGAVKLTMNAFKASVKSSSAPALFKSAPDGSDSLAVKFKKGTHF